MSHSYDEILSILMMGRGALPDSGLPPSANIAVWLENLPVATIRRANEECRMWIDRRHWSQMPADVIEELYMRFSGAAEICATSNQNGAPVPSEWEELDFLQMLLFEWWKGSGMHWARMRSPPASDPSLN